MIDTLAQHIRDKGFKVYALPGMLAIRKKAKGQVFGVDWAIPKHHLRPELEQPLLDEVMHYLERIDDTIANYQEMGKHEKERNL